MKRKFLSLILVFAMTVSLLTVGTGAVEPTYGDTAGHWAESSIERWSAYGIIQGSNGQFDPNGQLTCAQLATILAKLLKLPAAKDAGFTDNTADAWYYDAVNRCAAAGILNGNGDSTVTPEAPITRERAIVMLGRALGIQPIRESDLTKYTDAAKVAPYAQGMVAAMIKVGIVGGVTADELAPQDNINRASTVTILDRAISTYADQAGTTVKADGKGIVLVVADDVTVTGDVDKLLVPADNVDVTVSGSKNIDDITVTGDNSKVILNNSTANDVTLDGKNTELETKGGSKVENVSVTEDAKGATVNAGSGTTVKNVENSAADTTVTGSGSVKNVASDTDVTVETKGTEVKNTGDGKITVTDKNGKDSAVNSGSSSTTTGGTTSGGSSSGSSGGSSGGSSTPSHTHAWATEWSHDGTHHWHNCTAANCTVSSNEGKKDYAAHTFTYTDNGDGTHTKSCPTCGYSVTEAHSYGESGQCACGLPEPEENALASVKQADGTYVYYTSVQNAINAAPDNATVKLLKNLEVDTQTIVDKDVTLDLAGHKLTSNSQPWVKDNGVLTITDSRDNGEIVLSSAGIMLNEGKLVLNKGKIHALTNSDVVFIMGTGGFTMHGGMLLAEAGACIDASYGSGESRIDITGGTVTTKDTGTNAIYIASRFGQGKVIASISGGTFTTGGQPAVCVDDQNSTLSITGGTFSSDPTAYVADGYITLVNGDGTFTVSNATEIPVTKATVQDYLDGKYGSINGKTLVLGGDNYGKIEFGRATAYAGSNTEYYLSGTKSTPDAIKQDIADHPKGGAGAREYVRYLSNVTLKAADNATVSINGLVAFGGQVNSTKWYSRDFVADRDMSATENNNICYWTGQNWSNITFEGLTFTDGVNIEAYGNKDTLIDNVKFDNCKFNIANNENATYCIRLNVDGKDAKANNLIVAKCVFTNGLTAVLTDGMPNVTVTDSTFSGLVRHAINPMMENSGAPGYGIITVTGNTFKNMSTNADKGTILRMGEVGAGAVFTIQNNTATEGITLANSIKVTSLADDGITYNISGNKWGSLTASDPRLKG